MKRFMKIKLCFFLFFVITANAALAQIKGMPTLTHVSCVGGISGISLSPTGGTSPYTYLWQPGSITTSSINHKPVGSYTVTIKDATSAMVTYTYNIGYKVFWQNFYPGMVTVGDDLVQSRSDAASTWLETANSSNILSGSTDVWPISLRPRACNSRRRFLPRQMA